MSLERHNPHELSPATGFSHAVAMTGGGSSSWRARPRWTVPARSWVRACRNSSSGRCPTCWRPWRRPAVPPGLARVTVYAVDVASYREHAGELGRIWRRLAGRDYPAMAVVGVVRLWDEEALVELDGIAVLP